VGWDVGMLRSSWAVTIVLISVGGFVSIIKGKNLVLNCHRRWYKAEFKHDIVKWVLGIFI
jgi:hypothetical protein